MAPSRNGPNFAARPRLDGTGAPRVICSASPWSAIIWPKDWVPSDCPGPMSGSPLRGDPLGLICLHRAGKRAAVQQDVLAGDEAGLGAAEECAGNAEFLGIAGPAGRVFAGPLLDD